MNQFCTSISLLLALLCISFAPAQAEYILRYNLKEGSICDTRETETFNNGNAYLYEKTHVENKKWRYFDIGDGSGKHSEHFVIDAQTVAVTDHLISIEYSCWKVELTLDGKENFDFYREMFPYVFRDYSSREFSASRIFVRRNVYDVTVIKVRKLPTSKALLLVALHVDGDTERPRVILPRVRFEHRTATVHGKEVAVILRSVDKIIITVEFKNAVDATTFYDFVKTLKKYSVSSHYGNDDLGL